MKRIVALLAAILIGLAAASCGGDGAEPGAPGGATLSQPAAPPTATDLVLDFTPNAVHSGIYSALARGYYTAAGLDLHVHPPGASTDAPKLLAAGRTDFAILDIHDLGIARERGLDVVGVMPIVQTPLAAVIARRGVGVNRPRDLEGKLVGVTGLPSDDAVVDTEVAADGGDPSQVRRVTIGFNAVASLAAGKVDAATGFRNAEAVALRRSGVPINVFEVENYGAPKYPELVLCTTRKLLDDDPGLVNEVVAATARGYRFAAANPSAAIGDLLDAVPSLNRGDQEAQMQALRGSFDPVGGFDRSVLEAWARWDLEHGILKRPLDVDAAFASEISTR